MKQIKSVGIVGRGGIGVNFASFIYNTIGPENIAFIADEKRKQRYQAEGIIYNGKKYNFKYVSDVAEFRPVDLLILSTKYTAIRPAIEEMRPFIKDDTIIISTLNGVKSEEDLRAEFGREKVVRCIARAMAIVYKDNIVTADPVGELVIGAESEIDRKNVASLAHFFDQCHLPYVISKQIVLESWNKLMFNCGVNQACAAYNVPYGEVKKPGKIRDQVLATMKEVQAVANKLSIPITDQDVKDTIAPLDNFNSESMPSMRQDVLAHRKTELELFAGYIVPLGHKLGVSVPNNELFLQKITEIESKYWFW